MMMTMQRWHQLLEFGNSDVLPANLGVLHQYCHANYLSSYMVYYHILNYYLQNWVYQKNYFLGISSDCEMSSASKKLGVCTTIFCILHSYPHLDYTKTLRLDRKTLKFPDIYGVQICRQCIKIITQCMSNHYYYFRIVYGKQSGQTKWVSPSTMYPTYPWVGRVHCISSLYQILGHLFGRSHHCCGSQQQSFRCSEVK